MQRRNALRQCIEDGGVVLRGMDAQGAVIQADHAGDVRCAALHGDLCAVLRLVIGDEALQRRGYALGALRHGHVAVVGIQDGRPEVRRRRTVKVIHLVAPDHHGELDLKRRIAAHRLRRAADDRGVAVQIGVRAVGDDLLAELFARRVHVRPERPLGVRIPETEVAVVPTRRQQQLVQPPLTAAIGLQALDGQPRKAAGAVVVRVRAHVDGEDHVGNRHRRAVGEARILPQAQRVIGAAVRVDRDLNVGQARVVVGRGVKGKRLARNASAHNIAAPGDGQQRTVGQVGNQPVALRLGEKGIEIAAELADREHRRSGFIRKRARRGQQGQRKQQRP